jgi:hypothetical protein
MLSTFVAMALAAPLAADLPDFSHAGYARGEVPLPDREPTVNARDFGATPDDDTDDTAALQEAIDASAGEVILIPAGRYVLSDRLTIASSDTVLRGEGIGKTVLHFTRPLEAIQPNRGRTGHGTATSNWSWSGGLVRIMADNPRRGDGIVPAEHASEGGRQLLLPDHPFEPGDSLLVIARNNDDNALARHLYNGIVRDVDTDLRHIRAEFVANVASVEGDRVTLDRPLRFDADPSFVRVHRFEPAVTHSGIESFTIDFPVTPYAGHFKEEGFNGIRFSNTVHCWARDVEIVNADSGAFVSGHFNTLAGIVLRSDRDDDGGDHTGHHGFYVHGSDNLITGFDIQTRFIHDLSVGAGSVGTVWSQGKAVDLAMDNHRWAPFQSLFSDIDAGAGTRYFRSGGTRTRGLHTARGTVFWNIRGDRDAATPKVDFGPPGIFFVGVEGLDPSDAREGWVIRPLGNDEPSGLHAFQREQRLARSGAPDAQR